jgi:uncharacterized protein YjbI with pentapeptide repeats
MTQPTNPNEPQSSPPSSYRPLAIRNLVPGMVIGILLGIVGFLVYQKHLPQVTRTLYTVTLVSFGVLVLSFVLLYAFKRQITALIFGKGTADAGEVIDDAQRITDALTDRFADTLLIGVEPDVRERVRHVLPRMANWFIWSRFRNWWWQWVLGIFVSLGGLTGTLLLVNQNELLQNQNTLIQRQMYLDEANRRSALVVLMSNIFDKVDREIETQQKIDKDGKYNLSQSLIGQIVALSHSFKPYRYLSSEGGELTSVPLSPERGQLLITLTWLPLDTATLNKIYHSANFEDSALREAILDGAYLSGANLSRSNMFGTNINRANLSKANLDNVQLTRANLEGTNLSEADLKWADLIHTFLSEADLSEADLSEADLSGANLRGANLGNADLGAANLGSSDLKGASLNKLQLSLTVSLKGSENLHDSLKLPLQQSHPHLFQAPKD